MKRAFIIVLASMFCISASVLRAAPGKDISEASLRNYDFSFGTDYWSVYRHNYKPENILNWKEPEVMTENINLASSHGISTFIFDWYYYNDGPFLSRALEEGFFGADNAGKLKFCTMWANHDWVDIHPCTRFGGRTLLYPGKVTRETFEKIARIHVENYFSRPDYYTIDGKPVVIRSPKDAFALKIGMVHQACLLML